MSYLSAFLGNKPGDTTVHLDVDKAAAEAKRKVKGKLTGKKQETNETWGMEGILPSKEDKDKKPKEKAENPGGAISAGGGNADSSFNHALANKFGEK